MSERNEPARDQFRALYIMADGFSLAEDLTRLYAGTLPANHLLQPLLHPVDQRGEVAAWGGPHFTILDALTTRSSADFARTVRDVVRSCQPVAMSPTRMTVYGKTALVIEMDAPGWTELRHSLIGATRHLITRAPVTDEEIQHARWHIVETPGNVDENLKALEEALAAYYNAGSPALPSSRHFRLGHLVRLWKAGKPEHLEYFLTWGEPYWYGRAPKPHLSIVTGLDRSKTTEELRAQFWQPVLQGFPAYVPRRAAIMGESDSLVTVNFFDWLTETPISETRPGLKVVEWIELPALSSASPTIHTSPSSAASREP